MSKKTPTRKRSTSRKTPKEAETIADDVSPAESEPAALKPTPIRTAKGPNTPQKDTIEARLDAEIEVYTEKVRKSPHRSEGEKVMIAVLSVLQRIKGGV